MKKLLADRRILVVVGSGGVGKTTISATLALSGAILQGKKTLVLTIDPARRLADSLGLRSLGHDIQAVPEEVLDQVAARRGVPRRGGSLSAMMLDQKRAFDEMVARYAKDPKVRERIFQNAIYQQISATLAGSHEYAAMAKLYEVAKDSDYELIVLDTPPTANALDFLDAPDKVTQAIDSPAIQWLVKPYLASGGGGGGVSLVGMGGAFILKRIARFTGSEFLNQMAQFFVEFNQVLGGFQERAREVFTLLRRPEVAFVLCSSPEVLTIEEALYFHQRLRSANMPLGGFVVNRVHTAGPAAPDVATLEGQLSAQPALRGFLPDDLARISADLLRTYAEQQLLAQSDAAALLRLREADPAAPLVPVPLLEQDIFGVEGLALVSEHLVA